MMLMLMCIEYKILNECNFIIDDHVHYISFFVRGLLDPQVPLPKSKLEQAIFIFIVGLWLIFAWVIFV